MSKKRKKKTPLRDEFTDALNLEMEERKIIERVKLSKETEFLQKETAETSKVEVSAVSVEKNSVEKVEVEKIPAKVEETPAPRVQIVEVEVDKKLEEQVLKETDSTFFEEKPPEINSPKVKKPRKSIFRSKGMQLWEAEQRGEETPPPPKVEPAPKVETPRKLSRPEKFGSFVSVVMLVYAFVNMDKPLFFLALSMISHFIKQPLGTMFGKYDADVQNALHSFSIVIFLGAIMFLFTD
jgi:hypothetical protein